MMVLAFLKDIPLSYSAGAASRYCGIYPAHYGTEVPALEVPDSYAVAWTFVPAATLHAPHIFPSLYRP